jgi:inhibitor of nuclear factor kappa-B kinase subunit alpha
MPRQGRSTNDKAPSSKVHLLNPAMKEIRRTRAKCLLRWHAENGHENILFTDEKISPSRSSITTSTTRFMLKSPLRCVPRVQGGHHSSCVMAWWGVSLQRVTPLHFCEKGKQTGARVYQEDLLKRVVKPLNTTVFSGQKWVFQQNSAPAHKSKKNQK